MTIGVMCTLRGAQATEKRSRSWDFSWCADQDLRNASRLIFNKSPADMGPLDINPPPNLLPGQFITRTKAQSCWQIWSVIMEVLDMTQRGNHCRLVWSWIRPRCKLRWKHVKRWWEGCPGVVSRNCNVGEILKICRWAFVRIPTSVLWAHGRPLSFCPHTRPDISKGKRLNHFLCRQEPDVCLFVLIVVLILSCTLFERYLSGRAWLGYNISPVELDPLTHHFWWPWRYWSWKCQKSEIAQSLIFFR